MSFLRLRLSALFLLSTILISSCFAGTSKKKIAYQAKDSMWETYSQAMSNANQDNKMVCLYFTGSDWCMWCKRMDKEILSTGEFREFAQKHFHLVKLDFPRMGGTVPEINQELKQKYAVRGFPTLVIIDSDGNEILRDGYEYGGGAAYVDRLQNMLVHR